MFSCLQCLGSALFFSLRVSKTSYYAYAVRVFVRVTQTPFVPFITQPEINRVGDGYWERGNTWVLRMPLDLFKIKKIYFLHIDRTFLYFFIIKMHKSYRAICENNFMATSLVPISWVKFSGGADRKCFAYWWEHIVIREWVLVSKFIHDNTPH